MKINKLERTLSNFFKTSVVIVSMRMPRTSKAGKFSKLLIYAPIALEIISLIRKNQKAKQTKYTKARKRDQAVDFLLGQAQRKMGKKSSQRRWF